MSLRTRRDAGAWGDTSAEPLQRGSLDLQGRQGPRHGAVRRVQLVTATWRRPPGPSTACASSRGCCGVRVMILIGCRPRRTSDDRPESDIATVPMSVAIAYPHPYEPAGQRRRRHRGPPREPRLAPVLLTRRPLTSAASTFPQVNGLLANSQRNVGFPLWRVPAGQLHRGDLQEHRPGRDWLPICFRTPGPTWCWPTASGRVHPSSRQPRPHSVRGPQADQARRSRSVQQARQRVRGSRRRSRARHHICHPGAQADQTQPRPMCPRGAGRSALPVLVESLITTIVDDGTGHLDEATEDVVRKPGGLRHSVGCDIATGAKREPHRFLLDVTWSHAIMCTYEALVCRRPGPRGARSLTLACFSGAGQAVDSG